MNVDIDWDVIRKRYEALQPLPDSPPGDYTWVDRLRTWDDFLKNGPTVSVVLRKLYISAANYDDFCSLAPELHDLLMEAFPVTPEIQAELDTWKAELGYIK